jgi:chromodomain-helicase-DNA-binding protein 1
LQAAYDEDDSSASESSRPKAKKGKGRASASFFVFSSPIALPLTRSRAGTASNTFHRRATPSDSSEEEYDRAPSKKKKRRSTIAASKRSVREFEMPRVSSRNGKQLPNYNEAQMDFDLSESDDGEGGGYSAATEEKGAFRDGSWFSS